MSTASELLRECETRGIQLSPIKWGDLKISSPGGVLDADLISRIKDHKSEILALLNDNSANRRPQNAQDVWQSAIDNLDGDPDFPAEITEALRSASVRWNTDNGLGSTADVRGQTL